MRSYLEVIEELKATGIKPYDSDFYEFSDFDTPLTAEFERIFLFGQEFLDRRDIELNINPARLYFSSNNSLNAVAKNQNGYYLIEIYSGTVSWINEFFVSKKDRFNNPRFEAFRKITAVKGIEPNYFFIQFLTLYCFYHEAGHLIQQRLQTEDYTEFSNKKYNPKEISVRHIRELDADWYAASCMAIHAGEYTNDPNEFKEIAIMCLTGIYMFRIELAKGITLYYEEHEHPHPVIRLSYIIPFFIETFRSVFNALFDYASILDESIAISEILMANEDNNITQEYNQVIRTHLNPIRAYIVKIITDSDGYPYLSKNVVGI
jgi:hypothetical protein